MIVKSVKEGVVGCGKDLAESAIVKVAHAGDAVEVAVGAGGLVQGVRGADVLLELADWTLAGTNRSVGPFIVIIGAEGAV